MAHLTERFCPKWGKSIGHSVVEFECDECADRWCKDCKVKRPVHYGRCADCNATHVIRTLEKAHEDAANSDLRFGGMIMR